MRDQGTFYDVKVPWWSRLLDSLEYEVDLLALFRIADAQQTEWYDIIETFATTTIHHSRKEMSM